MKRRAMLLCVQNQRTVQQFKRGKILTNLTYLHSLLGTHINIWRCSERSVHKELSSQDLRDWA